jgi:hypothetical protein
MQQQEHEQGVGRSGERVAFNDDIFRKANEEVAARAEALPADLDTLPFICECPEETCTKILSIPVREYERIRSDPLLFFNAPGHDAAGGPFSRVVERHEGYVVIQKLGRAAEISEMLDED